MEIQINTEKLNKLSLTINDYLTLFKINSNLQNIEIKYTPRSIDYLSLRDRGYISISGASISLTDKGSYIFKERDTESRDYENLAETIKNIFPKGTKDGKYPWRGSNKALIDRLKKLDNHFGMKKYSDEMIIKATESYISRFERDSNGMRISNYFLLKDNNSDLISYLEMEEPEEIKRIIKKL